MKHIPFLSFSSRLLSTTLYASTASWVMLGRLATGFHSTHMVRFNPTKHSNYHYHCDSIAWVSSLAVTWVIGGCHTNVPAHVQELLKYLFLNFGTTQAPSPLINFEGPPWIKGIAECCCSLHSFSLLLVWLQSICFWGNQRNTAMTHVN